MPATLPHVFLNYLRANEAMTSVSACCCFVLRAAPAAAASQVSENVYTSNVAFYKERGEACFGCIRWSIVMRGRPTELLAQFAFAAIHSQL